MEISARIGYRHQLAALFARLFAMASLNVSGKDDIWIAAENLPIVHVPKCPVLVTLVPKCVQRARCVVGMLRDAGEIRVQHSDIEGIGNRRGIVCRQIVGDFRRGEALSMDGDGQVQHVSAKRLRLVGAKDVHVRWRTKLLDQLAGGIMIAVDEIDVDPGLLQPRHLPVKEQRRLKALQANVVEVAGDDDEVNLMGQRGVQQLLEGAPCRVANLVDRRPRIMHQSLKRSVKVDVGSVNELHLEPYKAVEC